MFVKREIKKHARTRRLGTFLVFWRQLDALVLAARGRQHLSRAEDLAKVDLEDVAQLLIGELLLLLPPRLLLLLLHPGRHRGCRRDDRLILLLDWGLARGRRGRRRSG